MKTKLELKPQTSLKTKTALYLKIVAAVSILGIVLIGVFFAISYFGTPKTSLADDTNTNNYTLNKTIIISEYGLKGHYGQKRDQFIELYNFSDLAIDLSGYKLEYFENKKKKITKKSVNLSGIIPADGYFVIALKNGKKSKDQPTNSLSYDFIIPNKGWKIKDIGYLTLKYGNTIIDNAGNSK